MWKGMWRSLEGRSIHWLVPVLVGIALLVAEVVEQAFSLIETAGKVIDLAAEVRELLPAPVVSPIGSGLLGVGILLMIFGLPPLLRAVSRRKMVEDPAHAPDCEGGDARQGVALSKRLRDSAPGSLAFGGGLLIVAVAVGMLWGETVDTKEGGKEKLAPRVGGKGGDVFVIGLEGNRAVARTRDGKVKVGSGRDPVDREEPEARYGVAGVEEGPLLPPSDNEEVLPGSPCGCPPPKPADEEGVAPEDENLEPKEDEGSEPEEGEDPEPEESGGPEPEEGGSSGPEEGPPESDALSAAGSV
jgi:hypothetical protein